MKRKGYLAGLLLAWVLLGAGCKNGQAAPELYLDKGIPETPVAIFTQNDSVSQVVKECCEKVLNKDGTTNIVVYSDSAGYYADEGLSYRELLLKRLSSGTADDLYLIPAEDVLEFDQKGFIYDLSGLDCISSLSEDALRQSTYKGKVFSVPLSYTGFGLIWNVDMLHQYQLEIPETLDEFYQDLVTLKNYYGDKYIIFSASGGWDEGCKTIAAAFGIYNDWMVDDDGNVIYMTEHKNYQAYMDFMKKLYSEGLLDSEFAVNTSNNVQEKLASSQAIMGSCSHPAQITVSTSLVNNYGVAKEDIGYICPLEGENGECKYMTRDGVNYVTCILRTCENAADAMNYMNLKVQNQEYICIGEEGVHFNKDAEGNYVPIMPKFTDDKGFAWWYINATDTKTYEVQWQARVHKSEYQWDAFENTTLYLVENRPEIYVVNPFLYKPSSGAYVEKNPTLKNELQNYMLQVACGNDKGLDTFMQDWKAAGGDSVKEDLQTWYAEYNAK